MFLIETEYILTMREAELSWLEQLIREIREGAFTEIGLAIARSGTSRILIRCWAIALTTRQGRTTHDTAHSLDYWVRHRGTALALFLKRAGIDATVYEARSAPADFDGLFLNAAANGLDHRPGLACQQRWPLHHQPAWCHPR